MFVYSAMLLGGCGPEMPATVAVTGQILQNGKPVANAQVGFIPTSEESGALPARGETDDEGRYTLRTYVAPGHEANGATPGDYAVTVQKTDVPADPAAMAAMFAKNPGFVPPQLLPTNYATAKLSPLKATVRDNGDNDFVFEVQGTPKTAKY